MSEIWNSIVVGPIVQFLLFLTETIQSLGIPFAFGFAIIALTLLLKIITYPLSVKQIRSMKAQQALQPRLAELQKKYAKDRERMSQEQMKMYREAGVNPLGGCLPLLIQMPILWGLFSAFRNPALQVISDSSFFFIPNLHCPGPTCTIPDWPSGVGWLWPLPPTVGWEVAIGYLPLPILLVATQILLQRFTAMATPTGTGSQAKTMGTMSMMFSLLFGYYSLIFPASLSLYYIIFNLLSVAQQYIATRSTEVTPSVSSRLANELAATAPASSLEAGPNTISYDDTNQEAKEPSRRPSSRRSRRRNKK